MERLSDFCYRYSLQDNAEDGEEDGADFVFQFEERILIDPNLVFLGDKIGEGTYSIVHKAVYKSKHVAVKIIQPVNPSAVTPSRKEKFQREVSMLSLMDHENVVKFIGAVVEPTMAIIIELVKDEWSDLESLPRDMVSLLHSCWVEDPMTPPELEISASLASFIHRIDSIVPDEAEFICVNCTTKMSKFKKIIDLKSHSIYCHLRHKHFCDQCGNAFVNKFALEQHCNEVHSTKQRHKKAKKMKAEN